MTAMKTVTFLWLALSISYPAFMATIFQQVPFSLCSSILQCRNLSSIAFLTDHAFILIFLLLQSLWSESPEEEGVLFCCCLIVLDCNQRMWFLNIFHILKCAGFLCLWTNTFITQYYSFTIIWKCYSSVCTFRTPFLCCFPLYSRNEIHLECFYFSLIPLLIPSSPGLSWLLYMYSFLCVYMCICVCAPHTHICISCILNAHGGQKRASGPMALGLYTIVSCIWVLGHDLSCSARTSERVHLFLNPLSSPT